MIHHEDSDMPNLRISHDILKTLLRMMALLIAIGCSALGAGAYNMRQTLSGNGLSNSAILSMGLDDRGFLWIGTCDGVNIADGTVIRPFSSLYPDSSLSGNIIEDIQRGSDGEMWVLSNYGLDRVSTRSHSISRYPQFHGQELLCPDLAGARMAVLGEDSHLYLADSSAAKDAKDDFRDLGRIKQSYSDVRCLAWGDGGIWVVAADGIHVYDIPVSSHESKTIAPKRRIATGGVRFAKAQDSDVFIITSDGQLCSIGEDGSKHPVTDISHIIESRGRISDLVRDHQGNFFISFMTDGVIWVGLNEQKEFMALDLGLQVGVFCLERSEGQDVVWIGSDCQGVYTFWDDPYSIRSYDFNAMGNKISHPVRAIYLDGQSNLWIGTKGDGLLRIPNIDQGAPGRTIDKGTLFTSANSSLNNNSVYGFCPSSRPILWIATDDGVNCYNYASGSLQSVKTDGVINNIHGIYEENDSTLWMTTLGMGVVRATIAGPSSSPELRNVKFYTVGDGSKALNQFFSLSVSETGRVLFCNRGSGVYEIKDDKLAPLTMKNDFGTNMVNDVFVAVDTKEALWLGTGYGLVKVTPQGERLYHGIEDGFVNNTIHDIVKVDTDILWISTNSGLVRFDPQEGKGITYGRNYGIDVTEYSDGAAFYNTKGIIFGGINGLTFIQRHLTYTPPAPYKAALNFVKLSVSGQDMPIYEYIKEEKNGEYRLTLNPDENYFALTVSAPDFIDALNYTYSYSLDGMNWIDNGAETTISFTKMDYGNYTLSVRYLNRVTGQESDPCVLKIKVKAPWYLSGFMKIVYLLLILGAIGAGVWLYLRRQKEKQEEEMKRLEQTHKEEVYEEKLKFFTNITHEFCTPLTLIYGPCERIAGYPGSDDYIRKYIGLVRTNAERLNNLIQELIDFRRMETGHKQLKVTEVGISELCSDIVTSFSELADRNNVTLIDEIEPSIMWPTDFSCLRKVMTNLISNAFKYTPSGGTIRINVREEGSKLRLSVYNTGKGISEDEKRRIFNRYSVLDNVEENAVKGLSARNGLGLAICHSMVDMLQGKIEIDSEVGKYADFIVTIPQLPLTENASVPQPLSLPESTPTAGAQKQDAQEDVTADNGLPIPSKSERSRILVVDDNRGILTLLRDSLSEYDVETADSADVALESIRRMPPDLIISDIMMPGTDGVAFTRMVRQNKHTMHLPLILLSAKNSTEEKVEGIESGADAYIGKPFSTDYLIAVVKRLLDNRKHLREYYSTSASAYEYTEGQLLHKEDKDFLEQLAAFIEEHIEDEDLGPEKLATHMKISVRNLYRKFKELDQLSPNDFIKHQRISYAAKLLLTTSATVQEILYRSGFTNRSHFYKEFDKRFGMTPKAYRDANVRKDTSLESPTE